MLSPESTDRSSRPVMASDATRLGKQLEDVRSLLARQRRVSGLVHHQRMSRHELVEGLVQRQHLVELQTLLRRLSIAETGRLIEGLTGEDRVMAWRQVDEQACDQVLE